MTNMTTFMPIILYVGGHKQEHDGEFREEDYEKYQSFLDNGFIIMVEELMTGFFSATLSHRKTLHDMSMKLIPSNQQFNPTEIFSELLDKYKDVDDLLLAHKIKCDEDDQIEY